MCLCGQFFVVVVVWPRYDSGGIGLRRVAHPDPHEGVLLHHGEAADAGALQDVRLAGDADAGAGAVEDQAVVAALQAFLDDRAHVQRRAAVAAHVEQGGDVVLLVAEQYDGLVADAAGQRCFGDFIGPGGDVPGVADEHGGFLLLLRYFLASVLHRGGFRKLGGKLPLRGASRRGTPDAGAHRPLCRFAFRGRRASGAPPLSPRVPAGRHDVKAAPADQSLCRLLLYQLAERLSPFDGSTVTSVRTIACSKVTDAGDLRRCVRDRSFRQPALIRC